MQKEKKRKAGNLSSMYDKDDLAHWWSNKLHILNRMWGFFFAQKMASFLGVALKVGRGWE
jgi:hypothetical protein